MGERSRSRRQLDSSSAAAQLELGAPVRCLDAPLGELEDLVIDPIDKRVTHLIVQPLHQHGRARLVPIELAQREAGRSGLLLRCTVENVRHLEPVQESAYLRVEQFPVDDPDWDVGVQDVLAMPYYDAGVFATTSPGLEQDVMVLYDRVPKGEVEVRRSSAVLSADGHRVGSVEGFIVDAGHITHIVLEHGHLWGRRDVTVPIGSVGKVATDTVNLRLTKAELGALPTVPVRRWHR